MDKIYTMHNQDQVEASAPDSKASFALRTAASKAVYQEMTVDEQAAVDTQAEESVQRPPPPDNQHR